MIDHRECYSKAEILRQKQELYRRRKSEFKNQQMATVSMTTTSEPEQTSTSDSEQEELEEFLNWRSKVV